VVIVGNLTCQYSEVSFLLLSLLQSDPFSPSSIVKVPYLSNGYFFLQFSLTHLFTYKLVLYAAIFILSVHALVFKANNYFTLTQKVRTQNAIYYHARCYNTNVLKITEAHLKWNQSPSFNFLSVVAPSLNQNGTYDWVVEHLYITSC